MTHIRSLNVKGCQVFHRHLLMFAYLLITVSGVSATYLPVNCTPAILWLADPLMRGDGPNNNTIVAGQAIDAFNNRQYYRLTGQLIQLYGGQPMTVNITHQQIIDRVNEIILDFINNDEFDRIECYQQMLALASDYDEDIATIVANAGSIVHTGRYLNGTIYRRDTYKVLCSHSHLAPYWDCYWMYTWVRNDHVACQKRAVAIYCEKVGPTRRGAETSRKLHARRKLPVFKIASGCTCTFRGASGGQCRTKYIYNIPTDGF
ncbi:hypothetical protein V1527DRAFT_416467 [Lipomyces starkeyi]